MGRLSKRTIQCRAARKQRDLQTTSKQLAPQPSSSSSKSSRSTVSLKGLATGVNFNKLGAASLQRYQQAFGLELEEGASREDIVWAIKHHFVAQEAVDEASTLLGFVQALRRDSSSDDSY
eukprot:jgi/Chrzof1/5824/Cz16g17070.t1